MLFLIANGLFNEDFEITPWESDSGHQHEVSAYSYGGTVVVAWIDDVSSKTEGTSIDIAVSKDGGRSFKYVVKAVAHCTPCLNAIDPFVFRTPLGDWLVAGLATVADPDDPRFERGEVFLLRCPRDRDPQDPDSWELVNGNYVDYEFFNYVKDRPCGVGGNSGMEFVYVKEAGGLPQLETMFSYDAGESFYRRGRIYDAAVPWVAHTGGDFLLSYVHLPPYGDKEFKAAFSSDGANWYEFENLTLYTPSGDCHIIHTDVRLYQNSIAASGDKIYLAYMCEPCRVGVAVSEDWGNSWRTYTNFGDPAADQINPVITAWPWEPGAVLMWKEVRVYMEVYHSQYTDGSWSQAEKVPVQYTPSDYPPTFDGDDYDAIGIDPVTTAPWAAWGNYVNPPSTSEIPHVYFATGPGIEVKEGPVNLSSPFVASAPGTLILFLPEPSLFKLYNSSGRLIKSAKAQGKVKITLKPGVYFVKVGEEVLKGVVR